MTDRVLSQPMDGRPPQTMPMRRRADVINRNLRARLKTVLPAAMRASEIDMWLVVCQEDNLDPVFTTMVPMDTWCPILQILVFFDPGDGTVECINVSGTNTHDLYERPYRGQLEHQQWPLLCQIIDERDPQRIGLNIGAVQWAAGGLTQNLYNQLSQKLPAKYVERFCSAEPLATRWLATLAEEEVETFEHVAQVAHRIIAECYSPHTVVPGVTTTQDLEWYYWQRAADLGLDVSFKPFFNVIRSEEQLAACGPEDHTVRPGDVIHCDVGVRYLRLNSDHQELAYVRRAGESTAPAGLVALLAEATRLQDIFMAGFRHGLTGDQLLKKILTEARAAGVPGPKVYSHSLGLFLHEPGPLIGLPWEQEANPGRGDVALDYNYAFTMELSVTGRVPEWGEAEVRLPMEEDVVFTRSGCRPVHARQVGFYLI